jgi:hypothetical protein
MLLTSVLKGLSIKAPDAKDLKYSRADGLIVIISLSRLPPVFEIYRGSLNDN